MIENARDLAIQGVVDPEFRPELVEYEKESMRAKLGYAIMDLLHDNMGETFTLRLRETLRPEYDDITRSFRYRIGYRVNIKVVESVPVRAYSLSATLDDRGMLRKASPWRYIKYRFWIGSRVHEWIREQIRLYKETPDRYIPSR